MLLSMLARARTQAEVMQIGQELLKLRQGQKPTIHTSEGRLFEYDPNTRQARELSGSDKGAQTVEVGDQRFQWNPASGRYDIPVGPPGSGRGDMFPGTKSIEGQALNHLVREGTLSRNQAAEVAAGKQVTGSDGAMYWLRPQDLAGGGGGRRHRAPAAGYRTRLSSRSSRSSYSRSARSGPAHAAEARESRDAASRGRGAHRPRQ